MRLLVTGGAGFIGSHYVRLARRKRAPDVVVNLDALTYAGNLETLRDLERDPGHVFVKGDIRDRSLVEHLLREHRIEAVVNCAAESHVDRSIMEAAPFLATNVDGALALLEAARAGGARRFVQIGTDEVYGSLAPSGVVDETTVLAPRNPYSASKAAADHLVLAFHHTHGLDAVITRCGNNYGPFQFPEKLIPLMIINALRGEPLPVYGDGQHVRDWVHVADHCDAIDLALERGTSGEVYNITAGTQRPNLDVVRAILRDTGRDDSLVRFVPDRPGHDRRYAMSSDKIRRELGWAPRIGFDEGLRDTVAWYRDNRGWWEGIERGSYREYYERQYASRLAASKARP